MSATAKTIALMRQAYAGEITVKTYWACNGLSGDAFRKWFHKRLTNKTNREDTRAWRRLDNDYQTRLYRDAQRVRDITERRVIVRQFETDIFRKRFDHLLTKPWEE